MQKLLFCFLVLLISCQKKDEKSIVTGAGGVVNRVPTQAELDVYVEGFREKLIESGLMTTELEGRLAELEVIYTQEFPTNIIGSCAIGVGGRLIRINQNFWAGSRTRQSSHQQLMYHELAHCIFQVGHDESTATLSGRTAPASLMNPLHIEPAIYEANLAHYQSQLFQSSTPEFLALVATHATARSPRSDAHNCVFEVHDEE